MFKSKLMDIIWKNNSLKLLKNKNKLYWLISGVKFNIIN